MTQAKCNKCGGSAVSDTYEKARALINHAVGLSRGIKCGDNYNQVCEIKSKVAPSKSESKPVENTPKSESKPSTEKPKEKKIKSSF